MNRYFTTPILLSESLCKLGADTFLEAIREAGKECELDELTRTTFFAPLNPTSDCVDDAVVADFLGYTTDLTCGTLTAKSGAKIEITQSDDGTFYVNGDPIVKSDIVLKNGVVHFVDNVSKPHI